MANNKEKDQAQDQAQDQEQKAPSPASLVVFTPVDDFDFSDMGFSDEDLAGLTGLDSIDASEIRIPYAELQTKDPTNQNLKKGDIVFPDGTVIRGWGGEVLEDIAVLQVRKVRSMFPTPFNPKNSFTCRSIDGIVGHTDGQYAGRQCASCEFAAYPKEGGASPCRDQRLLLCSKANGEMFHIQIGGVGVGEWKNFLSTKAMPLLNKVKGIMCTLRLTVAVKTVNTDYGPFPALDFKLADSQKPFFDKAWVKDRLDALVTYRKFEKEYLESAATQTKAAMAAGMDDAPAAGGNGANADLF